MSRAAWLGALLVLAPAAVVTWTVEPGAGGDGGIALRSALPVAIDGWRGMDAPLDDATLRILRTDDYVNRTFARSGAPPVTLTSVFSRRERKTVHPPEVCFTGHGWEIEEQGTARLGGEHGPEVATLRLARDGERLHCLYWYVAGERSTASFVRQQWNVALGTLAGEAPGSAMVRFMATSPAGTSPEPAARALRELAEASLPHVAGALR